jgi:uncharacterized protein YqhQ
MSTDKLKLPNYGGQALIEGVLMRGAKNIAAAFRMPDSSINVQSEALTGIYASKIAKIPFLRALVILWDSLGLGMRYLTISANMQAKEGEKLESGDIGGAVLVSLAIAVGLFFLLPAGIGRLVGGWFDGTPLVINLIEGFVRLILVIGYIWAIGFMPDIRRVFAYHGAEHKTINAFESGAPLTPESVAGFSLQHPRCGTSFVLTMVVFSVIVFALLGDPGWIWLVISRIVLLPVIAMLAYEYIRWISNHLDNPIVRFLAKPNLALQYLTTREPSMDMLEVAIISFNTMYEKENA